MATLLSENGVLQGMCRQPIPEKARNFEVRPRRELYERQTVCP
jgi:hypothetical protein